jgi:hypothetical protein
MKEDYHAQLKAKLDTVKNQTDRVIAFLEVLGHILQSEGYKVPLVVGGAAVEIYTHGLYMSQDIDIKSDLAATVRILTNMGFVNQGRTLMYSDEFDLLVDWQGAGLEEGPEAQKRALVVTSSDGKPILRLINIVDIVIDRLEAYKFGKDIDSLNWAKVLLAYAEQNAVFVDEDVLCNRAEVTDVSDILGDIWKKKSV